MVENGIYTIGPYERFHGETKPDLIENNREKITHFRRFGFFLVYWNNNKYELHQKELTLYYLAYYLIAISCFTLAYICKEYFKKNDYIDRIDDLIEAAFVGIIIGIFPAFWNHLLKEYNTHLPRILMLINKLEKNLTFKELDIYKNKSEISYREGWLEDDYNDVDDEENIEIQISIETQWKVVKYGPHISLLFSASCCLILIVISFIEDISIIIMETPTNSLQHLKKELPYFIMTVLYPIPYFASIWFCIFFLEWQRRVHESLRYLIRKNIKSSSDTKATELENIGCMLKTVQKVFILLNKKIFQKTIVICFVLFMFLGVFCCWKVLQTSSNFAYIYPVTIIVLHIYLPCSWGNAVMKEFRETVEVLNEVNRADVENLRWELEKTPPQVLAFGGFSVNYKMMTAVLAFIISCISIPEEMWPEDNENCYKYDIGDGKWNHTLCLKNKLYIMVNETLCLKNQ